VTTSPPPSPALPAADGDGDGERLVVLAAVAGAHGLGGEVRLKLFTDDLGRYRTLRAGPRRLTLEKVRGGIARFTEITGRTTAEALRGLTLSVPRDALPPLGDGEYYHADLLDLPCTTPAGEPVGRVVAIDNYGAGDVLEIERPDATRFMVPMRAEAVPEWNATRLVVDPAFLP